MRYALLLLLAHVGFLALVGVGCATGKVVQALTEPYSVEASVTIADRDTGEASVRGAWLNSRFLAVDFAGVTGAFVLRGPAVYGGPIAELRRFDASTASGRQAWEIVLPSRSGERTRLVATTWEAARASIPSMPE